MILGFQLQLIHLILGGIVVFLVALFQVLTGMRVIKFKGRTHMKVHRNGGWVLLVFALGHGVGAIVYAYGWRILS